MVLNRTVRLTLEKTGPEGGRLTIRVLDKDTQIELAETKVSLYLDNEIFEERITDENGTAEFYSRDRTVLFDAIINNEQYLVKKTTELTADDSTVTIQLEKFTGTNAGTLKVRAIYTTSHCTDLQN